MSVFGLCIDKTCVPDVFPESPPGHRDNTDTMACPLVSVLTGFHCSCKNTRQTLEHFVLQLYFKTYDINPTRD